MTKGGIPPPTTTSERAGCGSLLAGSFVLLLLSLLPAVIVPMVAPKLGPLAHGVLCEGDERDGRIVIRTSRGRRGSTSYNWNYECTGPDGVARMVRAPASIATAWVACSLGLIVVLGLGFKGHEALTKLARRGLPPRGPEARPT